MHMDQLYQLNEFQKIQAYLQDRILTEEDKQFKLDIEDIIKEHIYQYY